MKSPVYAALLLGVATVFLGPVACSQATDQDQGAAMEPGTEVGIETGWMDTSVNPGDDFFAYSNGKWSQEIPADRSSISNFWLAQEETKAQMAKLVKEILATDPAPGSNEALIKTFYQSFTDTKAIDAAGMKPVAADLQRFAAIGDKQQLAKVLGSQVRADVDALNNTDLETENLFGIFVTQALKGGEVVPYLMQGGLGMPSREYYLSDDPKMAALRKQYRSYIEDLLKAAGIDDAAARAQRVYDLETKLAKAHETSDEVDDWKTGAELWTPADFASKAPGLDWPAFFAAAGLDKATKFDAFNPKATPRIARLVGSEPLDAWKDWLIFHQINANADYLPGKLGRLHFGFYKAALQGQEEQAPRDKEALDAIDAYLGDAMGKLYVEHYFPASSKQRIQAMTEEIKAAFVKRLDDIDWLDPKTREEAKNKVASMEVGVGYPDTWTTYDGVTLEPGQAYANKQALEKLHYRQQLAKIGKPQDKGEWWMNAQLVNAVNLPVQNAINFPAAILQRPFYDPKADPASNYGAIGGVIGHELSHSFDSSGADFDANGAMRNWWTARDRSAFDKAGDKLAAQFDTYEPFPGVHVRGRQVLGENIADLAGLRAAYDAYRASLGGKEAPVIDGLTGDQRFFIAYAQSNQAKMRDEQLRNQIATDFHAPDRYRALTVRNLDEWYKAFDVKPGDKLYLKPEERVTIW